MRNLKKLLSVVLVVAMIAGLCAVGSFSAAAAEYSEVTNYKEAAAVITGVGVMDGYEDGTMQYDKTVTREEAAAIICRALIGVDTAKKLSTSVAPFADVAANRWSAPYINYLKSQGIVNGKTATQFDPTAEVTAVEFAKMMLCSVGYGKAGEFVGASWDVNTITTANNSGVYTGTLAADLTAPATREQCMLYAYNTMVRVPVVNYNNAFQSYYVGTNVVSNIDSRVPNESVGLISTKVGGSRSYEYTLAYRNFKLERTLLGSDDYGRPAAKWTANGVAIVEEVCSKTADYTLNGTVANSTIYNTIGASVAKNINKQIYNDTTKDINAGSDNVVELYINGVKQTVVTDATTGAKSIGGIITTAFAGNSLFANKVSGAGDTVEIYVDTIDTATAISNVGDYKLTIVVTSEFFGQVTAVSAGELTVSVKQAAAPTGKFEVKVKADDVNISGFAKKDYVLLNMSNPNSATQKVSKIIAAKAPVVGSYGGTNSMFQYIIDGNGVNGSSVISDSVSGAGALTSGNQYNFWYDSMGSVIYAELYQDSASSDVSKYAYLKNMRCASVSAAYDYDFEVQLVYSDGKAEWVHYNVDPNSGEFKFDNKTYYLNTKTTTSVNGETFYDVYKDALGTTKDNALTADSTGALIPFGKFYAFTKADNKVVLKELDATFAKQFGTNASQQTVVFNPNKGATNVNFGTYSTNSATKAVIVDANGNVINFASESKFADDNYTGVCLYTFEKNSKKIKNIFIYSKVKVSSKDKAFYVSQVRTETDYAFVNLYINGALVENAKIDIADVGLVCYSGIKVFDVTVSGGVYSLTHSADHFVNNNGSKATATDLAYNNDAYGYFELDKLSVTHHYAWATIDTVDSHAFWTAEADKGTKEAGNPGSADVPAYKYYFDGNTVIYNCTNTPEGGGKIVSSIEAGQHFIAMTKANATYDSSNANYCVAIWIVD